MTRLTDAVEKQIVAFLRAGGTPEIAAQAAGVSADCFARWLKEGKSLTGRRRYRRFVQALEQAAAQARLGAEVNIHGANPLQWLRHGPGRGSWGRGQGPFGSGSSNELLSQASVRALLEQLLGVLEAFPEARLAAAAV
ncbi:MAG: hypothetical protein SNJ82_08050, partial [Gemmataceae bacterium]